MTLQNMEAGQCEDGCAIQIVYCGADGAEHTMLIHTTQSEEELLARGCQIRPAMETYFSTLGYTLLSAQVLMRSASVAFEEIEAAVAAERPRGGHLRLAAVNGRRVLPPELCDAEG